MHDIPIPSYPTGGTSAGDRNDQWAGFCSHLPGITCHNCTPRRSSVCPHCTPRCPHGYPADMEPTIRPFVTWISGEWQPVPVQTDLKITGCISGWVINNSQLANGNYTVTNNMERNGM